jgi:arylsulfatase A-like enzyme
MNSLNRRRISPVCICLLAMSVLIILATQPAEAAGKARHVLIVVMDGLRFDSVTDADMPALSSLAKSGTSFNSHHAVFPSFTEVNGAALATGMVPAHTGIVANHEYRPAIDRLLPVSMQEPWTVWTGDRLGEGWIHSPTLPELARAAGLKTAVAGTKGVALFWDRSLLNRTGDGVTVFDDKSIPAAIMDKVLPELGPPPPGADSRYFTNHAQDQWTTRALTEKLWAGGLPSLSVLWFSEPDASQHGTGPGSEQAKASLRSDDDLLAAVLKTLEQKGLRNDTDVLVVSDHGFSTVEQSVDVIDGLRRARISAGGGFLEPPPKDSVLVLGLGGTAMFYVIGHDAAVRDRLVSFLQTTDWAGVVFTRDGQPGTFKLADVGMDTPDAPDVAVAMRWHNATLRGRQTGTLFTSGSGDAGQGMHGSLSRYDMHGTLIAAGPDFKSGWVDKLPSSNVDIAPTVTHILGINPQRQMDGRVLSEALAGGEIPAEVPKTSILQGERKLGQATWNQFLRVTTFMGRRYYDEGNAGTPPGQ